MTRCAIVILTVCGAGALIPTPTVAAERAAPTSDLERVAGVWLFDAAINGRDHDNLPLVWGSTLTVTGNTFAISKFMDGRDDLKGTVNLNPAANPKTIDLRIEELDLSATGMPFKISACTLLGVYKLDVDRLTISVNIEAGGKSPATFEETGVNVARIRLVKAPASFKVFPKTVRVVAVGPDGKPAVGAIVTGFMDRSADPKTKATGKEWKYYPAAIKTGADGTAEFRYDDLTYHPVVVRDPDNNRIAVVPVSPARLSKGELTVTLKPECRVTGTIVSPEMKEAGLPIGWTNLIAMQAGRKVVQCSSFGADGAFDLSLPPGTYNLDAYGSDVGSKNTTITVPADCSVFFVEPISLPAQTLVKLKGRPAPELVGVMGWKGAPVKLADLKGKYVLLEFWGYWCGPCVGSMPVLIELHEKFADKGLVIIGVHADLDGEIDTATKLDEKVAMFKNGIWKGKDLPFAIALTSGKRVGEGDAKAYTGPAGQYGIRGWPTTVLIGPDGKIVCQFAARDAKDAAEQVEKLLNPKK
jgi:uncharacterized protein (TIGR03067 family)